MWPTLQWSPLSSRKMYSAKHSVSLLITFLSSQNNSLKKKKKSTISPYKDKTDVFSEFVDQVFGMDVERALMKTFKGRLVMCVPKSQSLE